MFDAHLGPRGVPRLRWRCPLAIGIWRCLHAPRVLLHFEIRPSENRDRERARPFACMHARTHARTPMTARQHFPLHCPPPMKRCRTTKQFSTGPAEQKTLLKTEAWARMRRVNLSHLIPVVQAVVAPSLSRRYPFCWKEREIVIHRKADFKIATTSSSCCRHNRSDK